MAKSSLIVGEAEGNPVDIGPALTLLGAPKAKKADVRAAGRDLRMDLYVLNQGSCGYASVDTIPHLGRLLAETITPAAKEEILETLIDLHPELGDVSEYEDERRDEIEAQRKPILALATDDSAPVRMRVARLAGVLPKTATLLKTWREREKDASTRAALLLATAMQKLPITAPPLDDDDVLVRTMAALALVMVDAKKAAKNEAAVRVLVTAAKDEQLAELDCPFFTRASLFDLETRTFYEHSLRGAARKALREIDHPDFRRPAPPEPRRLDEALVARVLKVVSSNRPYAPESLLSELAVELTPDARVDLALDLLGNRMQIAKHWTYGAETNENPGIAERRRARALDLCLRLLDGGDGVRLDRALADEKDAKSATTRNLLALARARVHVRAHEPIPPSVLASLGHIWGCGVYFRDIVCDAVVDALGDARPHPYSDTLWWLADLSPRALQKVVEHHVAVTESGTTPDLPRLHVERWIAALPDDALMPLLADAAKRQPGEEMKGLRFATIEWRGLRIQVVANPLPVDNLEND